MALIQMSHDDTLAFRDASVFTDELSILPHGVYLKQCELILLVKSRSETLVSADEALRTKKETDRIEIAWVEWTATLKYFI